MQALLCVPSSGLGQLAKQSPRIVFDGEKLWVGDKYQQFVLTPTATKEICGGKEQDVVWRLCGPCYVLRGRTSVDTDTAESVTVEKLGVMYEVTVGQWRSQGFLTGNQYESSSLALRQAASAWGLEIIDRSQ